MATDKEQVKEAAIEENYLEKRYFLRLIPKSQGMEFAKNPQHIGYGGTFEGAVTRFTLYMDENTKKIINPFKSKEEQKYFEEIFGEDMNPLRIDNPFWTKYGFTVIKTPEVVEIGQLLDGNDPKDALAIKVLRTWKNLVAPSWEERLNKGTYKWALIPEDYEEEKAGIELDTQKKIWMHLGSIDSSVTKMKDFLSIYYAGKNKTKKVPSDATREFLVKELGNLIAEDQEGYIKVVDDKDYEFKVLIMKAIEKGAINKLGVATYTITGHDMEYNFNELVSTLKELKKRTDPLWIKIVGQVEND